MRNKGNVNTHYLVAELMNHRLADSVVDPDTELAGDVDIIADQVQAHSNPDPDDVTPEEVVENTVDGYEEAKEDPETAAAVETMSLFGRRLGVCVSYAYSILKDEIGPEVTRLNQEIRRRMSDELVSDDDGTGHAYTAEGEVIETPNRYDVIGWQALLNLVSPSTLANVAKQYCGTDDLEAAIVSADSYNGELLKLDTYESALNTLKDFLVNDKKFDKVVVDAAVLDISGIDSEYTPLRRLMHYVEDNQYYLAIKEARQQAYDLLPCYQAISEAVFDMPDEVEDQIKTQANHMIDMAYLGMLAMHHMRKHLSDARILILTKTLINEDMLPKLEEANCEDTDISKYIAVSLGDKDDDALVNIPVDEVIHQREAINDSYEKQADDAEENKQTAMRLALVHATKAALESYVARHGDPHGYAERAIYDACLQLNSAREVPLDTALYSFLITNSYHGTLVEKLYYKLGEATSEIVENIDDPNDDELDVAELSAMAELIADELWDHLYVPYE